MIGLRPGASVRAWFSRPWRQVCLSVLRAGLIVLWGVWAALAWWSAPRPVDVDQAHSDIAADRVYSVLRADAWDRDQGFWGSPPGPHPASDGMILVWTTTSGQLRYTAPDISTRPADMVGAGGSGSGAVRAEELAGELSAAAERGQRATVYHGPLTSTVKGIAGVLMTLCLVVVIAGPQPERGTRFFWFWIAMIPFGIGVLAWLATERPWSPRAAEKSRQRALSLTAQTPRRSGVTGFAWLLLGSLVAGVVTVALRAVLGPSIIPG